MKSLLKGLLILAMIFMPLFSVCEAGRDDTEDISVTATIPEDSLTLSWGMSWVDSNLTDDPGDDIWSGEDDTITVMDFGELRYLLADDETDAGLWFSRYYYPIFLGVISTSGKQYTINSTSTGLDGPGGLLPKGWGIVKIGAWDPVAKQFIALPEGTSGSPGPAQATDKMIYTSANPPTMNVPLRVDFAIPPYKSDGTAPFTGHAPIPTTFKGGSYSGTVKITVAD